jgi:hypothetical protein
MYGYANIKGIYWWDPWSTKKMAELIMGYVSHDFEPWFSIVFPPWKTHGFPRPQVFGSPGEVDCPPGAVPLSDQDQCEAAAKALSKDAEGAAGEG